MKTSVQSPVKKSIFLFVAISVISFSCTNMFNKSVTGNGNVTTEFRVVGPFTGIDASSGINVHVKFGSVSDSIKVVTDENLQEVIQTEVKGDVLHIRTKENIREAVKKDVFISVSTLDLIEVSSAAQVMGENELKCDDLEINMSSAGDLNVEVQAEDIDIEMGSSAFAQLTGTVRKLKADVGSAAHLQASGLISEKCNLSVSSAGNIDVNVSDVLNADASSAGRITYQGNPKSTKFSTSSAGEITEK
jgi:hypothetical protein